MGMRRTARQHDTTGVQRHEATRSAEHWEHQPNDRVITIDGPGRVIAVHDGPFPGAEEYEIRLEGGLGGGTYGPGQITASSPAQASVGTSEATGQHLASDDYPELGTLLYDRPDPASLRYTAELASGGTPMTTHDSPAADGGLGDADEGQIMWAPEYNNNLYHDWSLASRTGARAFDHYHPDQVYLRFGHWPENERSHNNVTGFPEEGVSVYDLDHEGEPMDPDPDLNRGHEHDEYCDGDCDLDSWNDDFGNDAGQEMRDRTARAETARRRGVSSGHPDVGHLVKGDMVGIGHDGEPLLNNVRRVGDWIDHRHLFVPGAPKHELARDEDDEDYEPPEEQPTQHTARSINGEHIDDHGSAPGWHRAANPNEYDRQSTEGQPDPAWIDDIDKRQQAMGSVEKTATSHVEYRRLRTDPDELAEHMIEHHGWSPRILAEDPDELRDDHEHDHQTQPVSLGHHHGEIEPEDHWCEVHQEYHDDPQEAEDHYHDSSQTDWDAEDLPDEMHRGLHVRLPKDLHAYVHDPSQPEHERARALMEHLNHGMGIGMHWSTDEQQAGNFAGEHSTGDGITRVKLTAETPRREDIETDPDKLDGAFHFSHEEQEIPLKRGTPLRLKSISWNDKPYIDSEKRRADPTGRNFKSWINPYTHHDFEEPQDIHVQEPLFHATASSLPRVTAHDEHENLGPVPSDRERLRQHMITDHGYSPDQLSGLPDPGQGDALEAEHELEHDELHDEGVGGGEFGSGEHIGMPHVHKEHEPEQRSGYAPFPELPQGYHPAWGGSHNPASSGEFVPAEVDTELPLHALSSLPTLAMPSRKHAIPEGFSARIDQMSHGRHVLTGYLDDAPVGWLTYFAHGPNGQPLVDDAPPEEAHSIRVQNLEVPGEHHRGRGVASAMMDHLYASHPNATIDHGERTDAGKGWWNSYQDPAPERNVTRAMLVTAARDREFRFHVTAAWRDVQAKAKRIRAQGGVQITHADEGLVIGNVRGDHNVYETGLQRVVGKRQSVASYSCGCKWGAYHWGASDDLSRFAGRMCSHALALQYEAASRGMFGRDVEVDDRRPKWVPSKVVVKYDIDTGHNIRATASVPEQPPILVALMGMKDGDPAALAALAAVNDLFGDTGYGNEPSLMSPMGPTVPWDHNESPASAGPLKAPEADNWGSISGSDMLPRLASLVTTEAFWQRLAAGAGAAAGVAEMGEAAAAPELAAAKMIPEAVNKVTDKIEQVEDPERIERANEGVQATLHDEPEPALPATDGEEHTASMGDVDLVGGSGIGGTGDEMFLGNEDLSPEDPSIQTQGSSSIVAEFQRSAAAQSLMNSGPKGDTSTADIARAAEEFLSKRTAASFTRAEQDALIHESPGVQASNTDRLDIEGTHYAELERMDTPEEDALWWI